MQEEAKQRSRFALQTVRAGREMARNGEIITAIGLVDLARHYQLDMDTLTEHLSDLSGTTPGNLVPEVSQFLKLEVGAALGLSESEAGHMLLSVMNLRYRHPRLWEAFCDGALLRWEADRLTALCMDLSPMAVEWVDEQICEHVGHISFTRLRRLVVGLIARAEPELAARKEEQRRRARYVHFGDHDHGSAGVYGQIASADAHALDRTVEEVAQRMAELGDERSRDERRAAAFGLLADPTEAAKWLTGEVLAKSVKRRSIVYIHLSEQALTSSADGIARVEGVGPLTTGSLPEFLRGTNVTVRPVVDIGGITPVDSYEIPQHMREAVVVRHPVAAFPFSSIPSRGLDQDHSSTWRRNRGPGQTGPHNLAPLGRTAHRAKTAGVWGLNRVDAYTLHWTSPLDYEYCTDPRGTRRIDAAPP